MKTIEERFWEKVYLPPCEDDCWTWTAGRNAWGYGIFFFGPPHRRGFAHRWSYVEAKGPIPEGLEIDHLCRNHACVNPAHLEAVTRRTNSLRGFGASGMAARRTHCPQGHPYDTANTRLDSEGSRRCLQCIRAKLRARYGSGGWGRGYEPIRK